MNPLLEKAQKAAQRSVRLNGEYKAGEALESIAWSLLYFAARDEAARQPLPPAPEPDQGGGIDYY